MTVGTLVVHRGGHWRVGNSFLRRLDTFVGQAMPGQ